MTDEKVMIDFDDEDFIITVSPSLDENFRWTGEIKVGITMADQDFLHEDDNQPQMILIILKHHHLFLLFYLLD